MTFQPRARVATPGKYRLPDAERYFLPQRRSLRVISENLLAPGHGFPAHPHEDMEIVTYVLRGTLTHKDSLGNGSKSEPAKCSASAREPV